MDTREFLKSLDNLNFIKSKGKKLYTEEGYELTYEVRLRKYIDKGIPPMCYVIIIQKDDIHIKSWICNTNEDVALCVKWWDKKAWQALYYNANRNSIKSSKLKEQFESLTLKKL